MLRKDMSQCTAQKHKNILSASPQFRSQGIYCVLICTTHAGVRACVCVCVGASIIVVVLFPMRCTAIHTGHRERVSGEQLLQDLRCRSVETPSQPVEEEQLVT